MTSNERHTEAAARLRAAADWTERQEEAAALGLSADTAAIELALDAVLWLIRGEPAA